MSEGAFHHHLTMPEGMNVTEVTLPDSQLCHYIADSELERLGEMRREPVMEICLAATGAFAGSIIPAVEQLNRFNVSPNPMGWVGLATCFIAAMSFAITIVTAFLWYQRTGTHRSLLATIRQRKRVPVRAD